MLAAGLKLFRAEGQGSRAFEYAYITAAEFYSSAGALPSQGAFYPSL